MPYRAPGWRSSSWMLASLPLVIFVTVLACCPEEQDCASNRVLHRNPV